MPTAMDKSYAEPSLGQGQQAAIEPGSYGDKELRDEGQQAHTEET